MSAAAMDPLAGAGTDGAVSAIRGRVPWAAAALAGCLLTGWLSLREIIPGGDYEREAGPSFQALAHGHLLEFLRLAPAYGGSLIERAPFALLPGLWGGGRAAVFHLVALPALLAGAALGVWLITRVRPGQGSTLVKAVTLGLCVASPVTFRALELGHPEELLGAVLCVAAVLTAERGRAPAAGILLGLAVANKEWALLAAGPALLALPSRRVLMLFAAGATAALVLAPLVLVGGGGFAASAGAVAHTGSIFLPMQLFALLGQTGAGGQITNALSPIAHPLIIALSLPLTGLLWHRRSGRSQGDGTTLRYPDALLLLALLLLARCMLDPWDNVYYPLPFLFALLAWETTRRRRAPILAVGATVAVWLNGWFELNGYPQACETFFVIWSLALAAWTVSMLYMPAWRSGRSGRRQETTVSSRPSVVRISAPLSVTSARSSIRTPQLPGM
jgi:hypothetical protein